MSIFHDVIAATIRQRSGALAESLKQNSALMARLKKNSPKRYRWRQTQLQKIEARIRRIEDATAVLRGEAYAVRYEDEE